MEKIARAAMKKWDIPEEWERMIASVPDDPPAGHQTVYQDRQGLREKKPPPDLGWWHDNAFDARALCDERFPPVQYVVPHLIPEGVTILAGRPKIKKSWLTLQIACAVAKGHFTLVTGNGESPPYGDVLYLALEDNKRRLQDRITQYYGALKENWPPRLTCALEWRRWDEGGVDGIGEWCLAVSDPRLVVVDILELVRPPKQWGQTDYQADVAACKPLIRLCRDHPGLSVIVVHHDRKQDAGDPFDTVSGTLGLQGGVDTIALLKKAGTNVTLYIKGRDLEEEVEKAVAFDRETCRWHILGEAATVQQNASRKAVLELLEACGTLTPRQLADRLEDISYSNAKTLLWRMAREGLLTNDDGVYSVAKVAMTVTS
jgi:hypothetical protein